MARSVTSAMRKAVAGAVVLAALAGALPASAHVPRGIRVTVTGERITAEADHFTKLGGRYAVINRRHERVSLRFRFKFVVEFVVPDEAGFHRRYRQKRWSRGGPLEMPARSFTRYPGLRISPTRIDHPEIADLRAQYGSENVYRSDFLIAIRHAHLV